ncbi:MAG TPA: hypothetical protein VK806_12415 [Bacteroidia bacterium]|jgi:hypothetical protein|nr:hypothetical protein [Bacteroidia bacterium]
MVLDTMNYYSNLDRLELAKFNNPDFNATCGVASLLLTNIRIKNTTAMKTVTSLEEYQQVVNEVRKSRQPIKIKPILSDEDIERGKEELDLDGVNVILTEEYDEIKPL